MTPDELAARIPRLYHVTDRRSRALVERLGLLSARSLVECFVADPAERERLLSERRRDFLPLRDDAAGYAALNDNAPLHFGKLAPKLDDRLTPTDWLRMLNERVFFWPEPQERFFAAGRRGGRELLLLTFDTASLARAYEGRLDLAPMNTGSALREPARRGLRTFTPASAVTWNEWRRSRSDVKSSPDQVREVSIRGDVPDAASHLAEPPREI